MRKNPSSPSLDQIDLRILRTLQEHGRLTNQELAERVGLTQSPCLRRVRRLEQEGIIDRYVAVLNQAKIGLPVSVIAQVRVDSHEADVLDRFERAVREWPEVMECYLMTGSRDYLLRVVVEDVAAYERFIKEKLTAIRGIGSIESSFALNQIKYKHALPI